MMFGIQIFVFRPLQTSRNTRHHKLNMLLSPQARLVSIQLEFICVLSVFAVSFQLLLSSLGSSTSSPPQISLTLSPIFSSVSVASPVSVSFVLILFSTVPVIHPGIDLPVVSCMWVHLVCSHHDRWKLSKKSKNYSVFVNTNRVGCVPTSCQRYQLLSLQAQLEIVRRSCYKHLDLSQQTQLETSQLPARNIYFYIPNIVAGGDVLISCQKYQFLLLPMELKIVPKTLSNVPWRRLQAPNTERPPQSYLK